MIVILGMESVTVSSSSMICRSCLMLILQSTVQRVKLLIILTGSYSRVTIKNIRCSTLHTSPESKECFENSKSLNHNQAVQRKISVK